MTGSDEHLSAEDRRAFEHRSLTPERVMAIFTHLSSCNVCRLSWQESFDTSLSIDRLARQLVPEATRFRLARSHAIAAGWLRMAAAAAVVAALAAGLILTRDAPPAQVSSRQTPGPSTRVVPSAQLPRRESRPSMAAVYAEPEWGRLVSDATATATLPFPDLEELHGRADVVRGASAEAVSVSPTGVVIADARPTFTWPARDGTYSVYVFDGEREIRRSPELRARQWIPERALPRGRTLSWQVEVTNGMSFETIPRPPAPPAKFRIAGEHDLGELERARTLYPDDDLLQAVLHARAGMRTEAIRALRRVPESDATAKLLDHYLGER